MKMVDETCTDILFDATGQPVADDSGDFKLVSGDDCWIQDLQLEAYTEEGELFYEDSTGADRYGFGMNDFIHAEADAFTEAEIKQRIKKKLDKRTFLDSRKTKQEVSFNDGLYQTNITIAKQNENAEYNLQLSPEHVEVFV